MDREETVDVIYFLTFMLCEMTFEISREIWMKMK